ncbi:hypothetical protein GCM10008018_23880 [Paenibacillus marchantiophytorum]|uniref:Spore coat associated protein CotJA n=1 Tax=Paenibacillus marchantiophytorum TaxID=1619310 RepID=A0ABQ1EM76_9BACL|nr:hypothetical protein GCM10008018_23880 [Paenibacillus marchantiophytorum]
MDDKKKGAAYKLLSSFFCVNEELPPGLSPAIPGYLGYLGYPATPATPAIPVYPDYPGYPRAEIREP